MSPQKPHSRVVLIAVVVTVVAACATVTYQHTRKIIATQLNFSHKKHASEADCSDCHGDVAKSNGPTLGKFIPTGHKACADCHEDEVADKAQCKMCHIGDDKKIRLARIDRKLKFSHAAHAKRVKKGCKTCHAKAYTATQPGISLLPDDMNGCTDACHKKDVADLKCEMCHRDLQRQGLKPATTWSHAGNFIKRHGALAKDAARCATCHDQTFCGECHARTAAMPLSIRFPEKVTSDFIHRGDWLSRHSASARAEPATCRNCHGSQQCVACHALQGLSPAAAKTGITGIRQVHSPDFMQPGSAGFHGRLARRDINRCASCHDQGAASNCISCHKVGALGGNPHPVGFKWRNKTSECRTNPMCATCHTSGTGCR
jgi:hypothetical protein